MGTRVSLGELKILVHHARTKDEIEFNDSLVLTREQGFPVELNFATHLERTLKAEDFTGREFKFTGKEGVRVYHKPPVRVFLVEKRDGKWIYWGLVQITDYRIHYRVGDGNPFTLGKFKIIYIFTPEEMKIAHRIIDRNPETDFFDTLNS